MPVPCQLFVFWKMLLSSTQSFPLLHRWPVNWASWGEETVDLAYFKVLLQKLVCPGFQIKVPMEGHAQQPEGRSHVHSNLQWLSELDKSQPSCTINHLTEKAWKYTATTKVPEGGKYHFKIGRAKYKFKLLLLWIKDEMKAVSWGQALISLLCG